MFTVHKTKLEAHTDAALTPMQVAQAYNFPKGIDVSKRTVAILELGGAFKLSDVVSYCGRYGLKVPQITTVFVDGATEVADPQGADGEVCLDIDVIAAVAPGLKIAVVFAPNTDKGFIDGVAKCLELDPDAISISWGSPQDAWTPAICEQLDALFKQAEERGINVFVAAGDNGSTDGENDGKQHCDYPAASPFVLACGGTKLDLNADGTRAAETVWSTSLFNSDGTGGGVTTYGPENWQANTTAAAKTNRCIPDFAGNADPNTGYIVDIDGSLAQIGGTSAVAPLYAALWVLLNAEKDRHNGNAHTKIYAHPDCFFDVTAGTNGAYSATVGYDCCTGLGVADGAKLLAVL